MVTTTEAKPTEWIEKATLSKETSNEYARLKVDVKVRIDWWRLIFKKPVRWEADVNAYYGGGEGVEGYDGCTLRNGIEVCIFIGNSWSCDFRGVEKIKFGESLQWIHSHKRDGEGYVPEEIKVEVIMHFTVGRLFKERSSKTEEVNKCCELSGTRTYEPSPPEKVLLLKGLISKMLSAHQTLLPSTALPKHPTSTLIEKVLTAIKEVMTKVIEEKVKALPRNIGENPGNAKNEQNTYHRTIG